MANHIEALELMEKHPYETVVVVGNGVVTNGWVAVKAAIEKVSGNNSLSVDPIHPIAYTICALRMLANSGLKDRPEYHEKLATLARIRSSIMETFLEFKKEGKLNLRISPETDYVEKLQRGKTLVITTNWDALLEDFYFATNRFSVLSIHGNIKDCGGIYLPTETSKEPYHELTDSHGYLVLAHRLGVAALESAKRIVIWGNSLDFTDAELCLMLGDTHFHGKTKEREYIVVDPSETPVARLTYITGNSHVQHINPVAS